jgi:hypothetical protein
MSLEYTAAGAQARSIMRWAWQDPQERAVGALEQVHELAAAATDPQALAEIQDAGTMLSRLVSSVNPPAASENALTARLLSSQMSGPVTIGEQLDLAAIHGKHIPGTAYTFRHGWIPLIGPQLNDKYPSWMGAQIEADKKAEKEAAKGIKAQPKPSPQAAGPRHKPVPVKAGERELKPEHQALIARNKETHVRAERAAARALHPATPRVTRASKLPNHAAVEGETLKGIHEPVHQPSTGAAAASAAVFQANPQATAITEKRVDAVAAARQAAANPPDFKPGTVGQKLVQDDPALASLAAPGASMAALKAYIDARVAAEVARQVGQITDEQNRNIQEKLAGMHKSQQRLIHFMRKQAQEGIDNDNKVDRTQLVMYNLFNMAAVGVAIGGIAAGVTPIAAAIAAGIVPIVNIIHDYVRRTG